MPSGHVLRVFAYEDVCLLGRVPSEVYTELNSGPRIRRGGVMAMVC